MSRKGVRAHERILVEWLIKNYAPGSWVTNVRVGQVVSEISNLFVTESEKRMAMGSTFIADAVVFLKNEVVIVEVETEIFIKAVCQVEFYGHLFGTTERFREHWNKPRKLVVVSVNESDLLRWWANMHGVKWILYKPIWWEEHQATRAQRRYTPTPVKVPGELPKE